MWNDGVEMGIRPATDEEYLAIAMDEHCGNLMRNLQDSLGTLNFIILVRENEKGVSILEKSLDIFFGIGYKIEENWFDGAYYYANSGVAHFVPPGKMELILKGVPLKFLISINGIEWVLEP